MTDNSHKPCKELRKLLREGVKRAQSYECAECVKMKERVASGELPADTVTRWVHLRTCQTCGITRCCDASPNKHASKHACGDDIGKCAGDSNRFRLKLDHVVTVSAEPGDNWGFCYKHDTYVDVKPPGAVCEC